MEKFKNNKIDIIITDIGIQKMNGLTMLSHIKKINPEIHILILSAQYEAKYFIEVIELSVKGYILKPFNMNSFIKSLLECIEV